MHRTNTLTQLEENSDDHTYDGENRAGFKERNQSIDPSSKYRYESVGQVGCRCGMKGASLLPGGAAQPRTSPKRPRGVLPVFPSRPPVSTALANAGWKLSTTALTGRGREWHKSMIIDGVATAGKPAAISVRKPTFLQKERWKVIQKARRKRMSFQAIGRKLGIHRASIKKYLDAEGPPTRQSRVVSSTSSSDNIAA